MTDIPLPATGSNNWTGWGAEQENLSDQIRNMSLVNVKDYGAVGNGTTNDYTAVAAAVSAVAAIGFGVVYFPPGTYAIGQKLPVPVNVYLVGAHPFASVLKLTASSTIPAFVEMGTAGTIATYTGIRNLGIDSNSKANTGLLMHGPQEGAGVDTSFLKNSLQYGIQALGEGAAGGTNMCEIAHSWVWTTGDAGIAGLNVTGGIVHVRSSTFVGTNRTVAAPVGSAGIVVTDGTILDLGNNCEAWESGRRFVRSYAQVISPESSSTLYGVSTSADSTGSNLFVDSAGWTNSTADINDVGQSVTIPFCLSYRSAGPLSNPRHFQRGWHSYLRGDVYKNDSERTAFGYTSPASGDTTHYKQTILTPSGWIVGSMIDGVDGTNGANSSSWNNAHHRIGNYHLWVDATGKLRMKNGAPTSDTDGTVVGTQT